jgi:hypothetical protein
MVRAFMVLSLLLAIVSSVYAQSSKPGTRPGDTVTVIVHKVLAEKRAQYDSLMKTFGGRHPRRRVRSIQHTKSTHLSAVAMCQ